MAFQQNPLDSIHVQVRLVSLLDNLAMGLLAEFFRDDLQRFFASSCQTINQENMNTAPLFASGNSGLPSAPDLGHAQINPLGHHKTFLAGIRFNLLLDSRNEDVQLKLGGRPITRGFQYIY